MLPVGWPPGRLPFTSPSTSWAASSTAAVTGPLRPIPSAVLAGYEGGKMAELDTIDYLFVAPSASVHRIQEAQTTIYHVLWELIQRELTAAEIR